ncbi:MAG: hypothetical protein Q9160_005307 [Pyrenula sp. 1 TL-2023]
MDDYDEHQLARLEREFSRRDLERLYLELAMKRASERAYRPQRSPYTRFSRMIKPSYRDGRSSGPFMMSLSRNRLEIYHRSFDKPYYLHISHRGSKSIRKYRPLPPRRRVLYSRRRADIARSLSQSSLDSHMRNMYRVVRSDTLVRSHPIAVALPGLRNPNNLCYRNSTIQFLMNLPPFTAWLATWHGNENPDHRHCTLDGYRCLACFLGDLTRCYWDPNRRDDFPEIVSILNSIIDNPNTPLPLDSTVNTKAIPSFEASLQAVGAGSLFLNHPMLRHPIYAQHDPAELINWLFDFLTLNGRPQNYTSHNELQALCQLTSYETRKCSSCNGGYTGKPTGTWITNLYLHHDSPSPSSSPTSVAAEIHKNLIDTYVETCSKCSAHSTTSSTSTFTHRTHLTHLPEVLLLAVIRSDYTGRKFPRPMSLTQEIDLAPYIDSTSAEVRSEVAGRGGTRYRLQAMIQHAGDADFGHYIASTRRGDGEWYVMDDDAPVRWVPRGVRDLQCLSPGKVVSGEPFWPAMLAYVRVTGFEEVDVRVGGRERGSELGGGDGADVGQEDADEEGDYLDFCPRMPGSFYSDPIICDASDEETDAVSETPESEPETASVWTGSSVSTTADNDGKGKGKRHSSAACEAHPRPARHVKPTSRKVRASGSAEREVKLDYRDELYGRRPDSSLSPSPSRCRSRSPSSSSWVSSTSFSSGSTSRSSPSSPRPSPSAYSSSSSASAISDNAPADSSSFNASSESESSPSSPSNLDPRLRPDSPSPSVPSHYSSSSYSPSLLPTLPSLASLNLPRPEPIAFDEARRMFPFMASGFDAMEYGWERGSENGAGEGHADDEGEELMEWHGVDEREGNEGGERGE